MASAWQRVSIARAPPGAPRSCCRTRPRCLDIGKEGAIARIYDLLARAAPGPVVEINRAVAYGRARGAAARLVVLDAIPQDALADSHLLLSVRGDLLERDGQSAEAARCFREAADLTQNEGERSVLLRRAQTVGDQPG